MSSLSMAAAMLAAKSVILLAGGFAASGLLRNAAAATRHRLWSLVLLACLALPVAQGALPAWRLQMLPAPVIVPVADADAPLTARPSRRAAPVVTVPVAATVPASTTVSFEQLIGALCALWALGSLLLLVRLAADANQLRRLAAGAENSEELRELTLRLGIRRPVAFRVAPGIDVPQASGLWRPVVMAPPAMAAWDAERRRLVLAHELAHVRRGDVAWLWVARAAQAAFWWNPLIWFAARRQMLAAEQACDDLALAVAAGEGIEAHVYAGHLVAVARTLVPSRRRAPLAAAMARGTMLESRVRSILTRRHRRAHRWVPALLAIAVCAGLVPLAALGFSQAVPTAKSGVTLDAVSIKPLGPTDGHHFHDHGDPTHISLTSDLQDLIMEAYGIDSVDEISGAPDWFKHDLFTITATTSQPADSREKPLLLKALLADRFQLRMRTEERDFPVFELTVAPGAPKFKPVPPDQELHDPEEPDGMFVRRFQSTSELVRVLNNHDGRLQVDRTVVDKTNLAGTYDMLLETEVETTNPGTPTRTFTAPNLTHDLQSELGLRLVPGKARLPAYVVIAASRPTAD